MYFMSVTLNKVEILGYVDTFKLKNSEVIN